MSSVFRKLLVISAGAVLLAGLTAGTLSAASSTKKTYSVNVSTVQIVSSSASGFTAEFHATFTNTTPGGTSSFNSLSLTAPDGSTISAAPAPTFTTTTGSPAGTLTPTSTGITVTNLYPVSYPKSVTLDFWATIPIATTCSATTWTTAAMTGSNLTGTAFMLSGFTSNFNTPLGASGSATSSITYTDANGSTVKLTNNSTTCVPITFSRSGNSVQILKPTSINGVPVTLTVDVTWDPEKVANPLPPTETDTPLPLHAIPWCNGTASAPTLPNTTDVSCLVSESSQIYGPDGNGVTSTDWVPNYDGQLVQVHDVIYLLGDYSFQRGS